MAYGKLLALLTPGHLMQLNVKVFTHDASTWKLATTSTRRTLGIIYELYVVDIVLADYGGHCLVPTGAHGLP